jgi:hypothetical protein
MYVCVLLFRRTGDFLEILWRSEYIIYLLLLLWLNLLADIKLEFELKGGAGELLLGSFWAFVTAFRRASQRLLILGLPNG